MVGETVVTGALFALVAGLYGSQFLLYLKIGTLLSDVKNNAEQAEKNTRLIHDHIIEGTNPHPRKEDCDLCNRDELYRSPSD